MTNLSSVKRYKSPEA